MSPKNSLRILWRAAEQFAANSDSRLGAALAYYMLFSVAPLLIFAVHVAGIIYGEDAARGEVSAQLGRFVGPEAADAVEKLVEYAAQSQEGTWTGRISLLIFLAGALGMFLNVRGALCLIWKLDPLIKNSLLALLLDYALALVMVFVVVALLLLSLAISTLLPYLEDAVTRRLAHTQLFWHGVEFGISLVLLTMLFAALFHILSGNRISWLYTIYGSLVTAFLFAVGKGLLGLYFYYASPTTAYGAAGSVVLFMLWVYYSSQILFFGAEMIQARRTRNEWMTTKMESAGRSD